MSSLSFRPLQRSDFLLLQKWLSLPHVAPWWNERTSLTDIEANYGPRIDGAEPTHVFVIEHKGNPIGWIQWYLWADYPGHARQLGAPSNSAGIDLAIGEQENTGLGLGPAAIHEFLARFVFSNPNVCAVITDPRETNLKSLRAFEKAGFRMEKTVQLTGENVGQENVRRKVVRLARA